MAKGKYCEYYWTTKKVKEGWVWTIRSEWRKGAEILQSSTDNELAEDKYCDTETEARSDVYHAIQDYYS